MPKYNKNIQKFIKDNNINIKYFEKNEDAIIHSKYDINQVVARWGIYGNLEKSMISIANIFGKSMYDTQNILLELNELFDETAGNYQKRSLQMLNYSKDDIIKELEESFYVDAIRLSEIEKDKYVIRDNGMHRAIIIKSHYINELSKCNITEKIEEIKKKYTIPVLVEKIDIIKTYSNYLLHLINKNFSIELELDNKYKKTNRVVLYDEEEKKHILNDKELIKYVKENIPKTLNEILKEKITKVYTEDEYFKRYVDKQLKGTIIEKAMCLK